MGLAKDLWVRHTRDAQGVKVRGVQYIELRKRGVHLLLNVAAREPDIEQVEQRILDEWGPETLMFLTRARHLLLTDPTRRDIIIPCYDMVDTDVPLSCISLLHVLMQPTGRLASQWQFQLNVYARSIHVDKLDKDLELLKDVVAWLLEPLEDYYWEDYDPVLNMQIGSLHKEVG